MYWRTLTLVLGSLLVLPACSDQGETAPEAGVEVALAPGTLDGESNQGLRWSPKGEKLPLVADRDGLVTSLSLGPHGPRFGLRLAKSEGAAHYDRLFIDLNRDGEFGAGELLETTPSETRNKFWSSFEASVDLPVTDPWSGQTVQNPYPMSLWYVEDPRIDDPEMVMRYSRDGWMQGSVTLDGVDAVILVTESVMDGTFDANDSWALAGADAAADLLSLDHARDLTEHAWLGEVAYQVTEIDPSGRKVVLSRTDPGMTRAEEEEINDTLAVDRRAARSGPTVAFSHDFAEAEARARSQGKALLVDFETTWCAPCKIMDEWVWTADDVVEASRSLVAVKVDGDDHLDLKERFGVEAFPTIILLSPEGEELRRVVGYVNVEKMIEFLAQNSPGSPR